MSTPTDPAKRALLIGCTASDLSGIHHDVQAVGACLSKHKFVCTFCVGEVATRDNILAEFRRLLDETSPGDTICIYYSGHGGLAVNPNPNRSYQGRREPAEYQYLAPVDIRADPQSFRGIFRAELSALIGQLSLQTSNITVVLDCCHASGMVRDPRYRAKAIARPWRAGVEQHITWLREQGYDLTLLCPEGNPNIIQLLACQARQKAFEYTDKSGTRHGLLTAKWLEVMDSIDSTTTWAAVGARVQELVQQELAIQEPQVVGPTSRTVFGLERRHTPGILSYAIDGGRPVLRGGSLQTVAIGDRYLLMPLEAGAGDRRVSLAEAVVTEVQTQLAVVRLYPPDATIPLGARGFLTKRLTAKYSVTCTDTDLPERLRSSPLLQLTREHGRDAFATVAREGPNWLVLDREHEQVCHPLPAAQTSPAELVAKVELVARAEALRLFQSGVGNQQLTRQVTVEWGVVGGQTFATTTDVPRLAVGRRIYVQVRNRSALPVFASVLGIGVDASISLLSRATPRGREVLVDTPYTLGSDALGELQGIPVGWSQDVPTTKSRRAAIVVVVTDMRVDLRPLLTGTWPHAALCASDASEVFPKPRPVTRGSTRGPSRSARYTVRVFPFRVEP